jgi:hypothetical protein
LLVDDVWPDVPESWISIYEDPHYEFFKMVANVRAPEDGKLLITLQVVDQSMHWGDISSSILIRVLR